jgi:DNA-binding NarL/FixJ family response regulator
MSIQHLCLSSRANQLLRWQQAFPQGRILSAPDQLEKYLTPPAVVWIHADCLKISLEATIARFLHQSEDHQVIVMSCVPTSQESLRALSAGAGGYCHALSTPDLFRRIVTVVTNGGLWIGNDLLNRLAETIVRAAPAANKTQTPEILDKLSARERDVAVQIQAGASNKEISAALDITERTVKAHLSSIFQKLGVRDRLQLILVMSPKS